jgi:WD40 repeat protein
VLIFTDNAQNPDFTGEAWALAYAPDGKILYSTTYDGRVVLWDSSSLKKIGEMETKGSFGTSIACVLPLSAF